MDSELKAQFEKTAQEVGVPVDRILQAYEIVLRYRGEQFEQQLRKTAPGVFALRVLHVGEAIQAAKVVGSPPKLMKKLLADPSRAGEAEAHVIRRLLSFSSKMPVYEPAEWKKKPDVLQEVDGQRVAYEVISVEVGQFEKVMWYKRQKEICDKVSSSFGTGSLDIYLLSESISDETVQRIQDEVPAALGNQEQFVERAIPGVAHLVFDPSGNVQAPGFQTSLPTFEEPATARGLIHDTAHDRSAIYEKQLNLGHTTKTALITSAKSLRGVGGVKIVRVFRPSRDDRVSQKILGEVTQLPPELPGLVVVEMGASPARLNEWIQLIKEMFDSGVYHRPSGVWLRAPVFGTQEYGWQEAVVLNSHAHLTLSEEVAKRLITNPDRADISAFPQKLRQDF